MRGREAHGEAEEQDADFDTLAHGVDWVGLPEIVCGVAEVDDPQAECTLGTELFSQIQDIHE